jgi:hypothetical protein
LTTLTITPHIHHNTKFPVSQSSLDSEFALFKMQGNYLKKNDAFDIHQS